MLLIENLFTLIRGMFIVLWTLKFGLGRTSNHALLYKPYTFESILC